MNADWIMNMLQQQKIASKDARVELAKIVKGIDRNMNNITMFVGESVAAELQAHIMMVMRQLEGMKKPFRIIPLVQKWAAHYEDLRWRYRFLVLEGPSCFGKTQFAKSLSRSPDAFMEVDCSSSVEPLLKDYKPLVHEVILFDEATPAMVIRSKKLFQAGASWVTLGQSSTNCHAYSCWLHRVRMVVCSNNWTRLLAEMSVEDQEWLNTNSFYHSVNEPLWVAGDDAEPRLGSAGASAMRDGT